MALTLTPLIALATTFIPTAAFGAAPAAPHWPAHPDWHQFVLAPPAPDLRPVHIVSVAGNVTNAAALTRTGGGGAATLTMAVGQPAPTVVLDYGQDVGGIPYVVVRSQQGTPTLQSSFSEGKQYIGPGGDNAPSNSDAGDGSRVVSLIVHRPGRLTNGLIQGGQRYQQISLTTPGTVTLTAVGIRFTAVRATPSMYQGWFDSSSTPLNRIWYDGAYTTQLDELPANTVPSNWRVANGALINDEGAGILRQGTGWSDYTASFDTKVGQNNAGWMVRAASPSSGYYVTLDDTTDTYGPPDTLREYVIAPSSLKLIADVPLQRHIDAGTWHHVSVVADGTLVTTSLDGHQVGVISSGTLPTGVQPHGTGSVGFFELLGRAQFRRLDVTSPGHASLYHDALARSEVLTDFAGSAVRAGDRLPTIMDGAKRDRVVWSGDLGVEGPNVFYSTGTDQYVKESLRLLGSYQSAAGESGAQVSPTFGLGTFPESGETYSASYSMDEVVNIARYYLYTGDLAFVRAEWPMITREMAYSRSLVDGRGLLATNSQNGMDWDYYDGSKTGEVTAYNDIYYESLTDAASLARRLGRSQQASQYQHQAATLRGAINRDLFNPQTGLYATSNLQPGSVAQDANALAVLDGVAATAQAGGILAALTRTLPATPYGPLPFTTATGYMAAVSPFVTNEEVQADFANGDTTSALNLLQTLWGYMDGPGPDQTDTDWELVGSDGSPGFGAYTSLAHGWSSGATADLSQYVLGAQPSSPGYATWLVQPHPGTLAWVEGDVQTPHGTLAVRWAQQPGGRFRLQVTAPAGTRGTLSVPVPALGATVVLRAATHGKVLRTVTTPAGAVDQAMSVLGGHTYDVDVVPSDAAAG